MMHGLFSVKNQRAQSMGTLTLGTITKKIPLAKIPASSDFFLYFKLNDHPDLVEEGAALVAGRIKSLGLLRPCFVTPEASTFALAHVLRSKYGIGGIVIYKTLQINDIDPVSIQYDTVTSTEKKQLFLGMNKAAELVDKDIIILDSVCTTGGTLCGTYDLLVKAGIAAERIKEATVLFTEGVPRDSLSVTSGVNLKLHSFNHLPVFHKEEQEESLYSQVL